MRKMILAAAAAAVVTMAAPEAAIAQGPPTRPEAQQAPGQQAQEAQQAAQRAREQAARGQQQAPGQQQAQPAPPGQAQRPQPATGQEPPGQARRQDPPGRARGQQQRGGPPAPAPDPEVFNRGLAERVVQARSQRHGEAQALRVQRVDGEVRMLRPDGEVFVSLREETLDRLGYWRVGVAPTVGTVGLAPATRSRYPVRADDPPRNGAPAFCRSGAGHPVWGANWCLDKGFGLGYGNERWGVARTIEDIIFRSPDPRRRVVERDRLGALIGEVALGRLALQAAVLGGTDPLTGMWLGETSGPMTLRVLSGRTPVAELVDYNRDGRVDTVVFNLGR
jgi:hypothetical protein